MLPLNPLWIEIAYKVANVAKIASFLLKAVPLNKRT